MISIYPIVLLLTLLLSASSFGYQMHQRDRIVVKFMSNGEDCNDSPQNLQHRAGSTSFEVENAFERSAFAQITPLTQFIQASDEYKEQIRVQRRTVFEDDDWVKFRSSKRRIDNLATTLSKGVLGALWLEVGSVLLVSLGIYAINTAISNGMLVPFLKPTQPPPLSLPLLPFQLSSPALGLLLVFRNNAGSISFMNMTHFANKAQCNNLCRQGMAYLDQADKDEHVRRIVAFVHVVSRHFRPKKDLVEEQILQAKLIELLGEKEAIRLMECDKFGSRPMQALTDISRVIRRCNRLDGSTRSRLDGHLDDITALFVSCDNLYQTPIPIEYTRHTERFLGIWLLLLPLGFAHETKGSLDAVPMAAIISLFLFGIEELSKELEEPFSILPLEYWATKAETSLLQMLRYENAFPATMVDPKGMRMESALDPVIGSDAVPISFDALSESISKDETRVNSSEVRV